MQDIVELERRITAAMERISTGVDLLAARGAQGFAAPLDDSAELARLNEALDEERMTNAQLTERLRALRDKDALAETAKSAEIAALTAQLASQTDEIATLRRVLAEAGKEIAALRHARTTEAEELSDIIAALDPLIAQAATEVPHA